MKETDFPESICPRSTSYITSESNDPSDVCDEREIKDRASQLYARGLRLAKVLVAVGLLGWLIASGRMDLAQLLWLKPDWRLAALGVAVFVSMFLPAVRWWWLLRIQQLPVSFSRAVSLTWAGYLAALFLPGAAAGDVAKGILVAQDLAEDRLRAMSTIIVDRIIGLYGLIVLGMLSMLTLKAMGQLPLSVQTACNAVSLLWLLSTLMIAAVWGSRVRKLVTVCLPTTWGGAIEISWLRYRQHIRVLMACLALSIFVQLVALSGLSLATGLISGDTSMIASLTAGPLVVLANCLPLTPGGAGVGEAVSEHFYGLLGNPSGAESMLLFRAVSLGCTIPFGVYWSVRHAVTFAPKVTATEGHGSEQ